MEIQLVAVGTKMPAWVTESYNEYAKRLPRECSLKLLEVTAGKRGKACSIKKAIEEEGKRILSVVPSGNRVIALDVEGKSWSTPKLSEQMKEWMQSGCNISLLVGGPDGLDETCIQRADQRWSLSALTLPHPLVRVVLAEQLYRAWTILVGHPYHRS